MWVWGAGFQGERGAATLLPGPGTGGRAGGRQRRPRTAAAPARSTGGFPLGISTERKKCKKGLKVYGVYRALVCAWALPAHGDERGFWV